MKTNKTNTTNTALDEHKIKMMLRLDDRIYADFTSEKLVSLISHLHYALEVITGYMNAFKKMKNDEKDACAYAMEYDYNKDYYDELRWQSHDFFETVGSYETLIMNLEKAEYAAINCNYGIYSYYKIRTDTPEPLKLKSQRRQYDCDVLHVTSHLKDYLKDVISEFEYPDLEPYVYARLTADLKLYKYRENYESLVRSLKIAEKCLK